MTSYQANFASHHTCDRHVGFLLVTFYLVHTTIPNYNRVTRILAHTLGGNFKSFCEVNQKFKCFLFFSLPVNTKRKPGCGAKSCAYRSAPRHANPLLYKNFSWLMQPSMANLNSPSSRVVKDSTPFRRRILRCKIFGKGESWPSLFLYVVNLYLIKFRHRWILNERTFYSFIILFIWKWILT